MVKFTPFSITVLLAFAFLSACASQPPWHDMSQEEISDWKAVGFNAETAQAWKADAFDPLAAGQWHNLDFDLKVAEEWRTASFAPADAQGWRDSGFDLKDAIKYRGQGLVPNQEEARSAPSPMPLTHCSSVASDKEDDPCNYPIIFLAGGPGSDLGCCSHTEYGVECSSDSPNWKELYPPMPPGGKKKYSAIGLVSVLDKKGTPTDYTVGSEFCGTQDYTYWDDKTKTQKTAQIATEEVIATVPVGAAYGAWLGALRKYVDDGPTGLNKGRVVAPGWDWRKVPTVEKLDVIIQRAIDSYGRGNKVTIVTHSMGGIWLKRYLYDAKENNKKIKIGRVLEVGTPHWGTVVQWWPRGFGVVQPGWEFPLLAPAFGGKNNIKKIAGSAPGLSMILGAKDYSDSVVPENDRSNGSFLVCKGNPGEYCKSTKLSEEYKQIAYGDIGDAIHDFANKSPQPDNQYYSNSDRVEQGEAKMNEWNSMGFVTHVVDDYMAVVGSGAKGGTPYKVCVDCKAEDRTKDLRTLYGDANIPIFSATQGLWSLSLDGKAVLPRKGPPAVGDDPRPFYFTCGVKHIDLYKDKTVYQAYLPYLSGNEEKLEHGPQHPFGFWPCKSTSDPGID